LRIQSQGPRWRKFHSSEFINALETGRDLAFSPSPFLRRHQARPPARRPRARAASNSALFHPEGRARPTVDLNNIAIPKDRTQRGRRRTAFIDYLQEAGFSARRPTAFPVLRQRQSSEPRSFIRSRRARRQDHLFRTGHSFVEAQHDFRPHDARDYAIMNRPFGRAIKPGNVRPVQRKRRCSHNLCFRGRFTAHPIARDSTVISASRGFVHRPLPSASPQGTGCRRFTLETEAVVWQAESLACPRPGQSMVCASRAIRGLALVWRPKKT